MNNKHTDTTQTTMTTQPKTTPTANKQRPIHETNEKMNPPTKQITAQIKEKLEQLKRKRIQTPPENHTKRKQQKQKNNNSNKTPANPTKTQHSNACEAKKSIKRQKQTQQNSNTEAYKKQNAI